MIDIPDMPYISVGDAAGICQVPEGCLDDSHVVQVEDFP